MPRIGLDFETHVLADAVTVGVGRSDLDVPFEDVDVLLTEDSDPPRPWVCGNLDEVASAVASAPLAAAALVQVLRVTSQLPVPDALTVESMAYSMLQHSAVFRRWLREREAPGHRVGTGEPVRLERTDGRLDIVLHRPEVHNALDAAMRDALCEAFELVSADASIQEVHLRGDGPSFCSGGDLSEFGRAADAGESHRIRTTRSVGRAIHRDAARVIAHVHGACVGAGVELSCFAGRVVARPDATFLLPELRFGLIPGAGGTVSLPRRIGRHRSAFLALTGVALDAGTARQWGLVDDVTEREPPAEQS